MPPVQVRPCSGPSFLLGSCSIVVCESSTSWTGLLSLPQGPKTASGAQPVKCDGRRANLVGTYNWTMDGSRKPSPQVLRRVRLSSKGCQRTPTLGTAAFVSLFSHSSYRTPAENSNEWKPGKCHLGLKTGIRVSA